MNHLEDKIKNLAEMGYLDKDIKKDSFSQIIFMFHYCSLFKKQDQPLIKCKNFFLNYPNLGWYPVIVENKLQLQKKELCSITDLDFEDNLTNLKIGLAPKLRLNGLLPRIPLQVDHFFRYNHFCHNEMFVFMLELFMNYFDNLYVLKEALARSLIKT